MFTHAELLNEAPNLRKLAIKLTCNLSDAEKLLQSTLLTALDRRAIFQSDIGLFSWSSKIMFEIFASSQGDSTFMDHPETPLDANIYANRQFSESYELDDLEMNLAFNAMHSLPEHYREILVMVCLEGMKYSQVAQVLEISVETVRSRLSRARNALEEKMRFGRVGSEVGKPFTSGGLQALNLSRPNDFLKEKSSSMASEFA